MGSIVGAVASIAAVGYMSVLMPPAAAVLSSVAALVADALRAARLVREENREEGCGIREHE